jgi:hypothetical protein
MDQWDHHQKVIWDQDQMDQWDLRQEIWLDQDQMDQWDLLQRAVIHYLGQELLLQMEECHHQIQ